MAMLINDSVILSDSVIPPDSSGLWDTVTTDYRCRRRPVSVQRGCTRKLCVNLDRLLSLGLLRSELPTSYSVPDGKIPNLTYHPSLALFRLPSLYLGKRLLNCGD